MDDVRHPKNVIHGAAMTSMATLCAKVLPAPPGGPWSASTRPASGFLARHLPCESGGFPNLSPIEHCRFLLDPMTESLRLRALPLTLWTHEMIGAVGGQRQGNRDHKPVRK